MPVLVSFLAIDVGAALGNETNLTTGNIIGFAVRYVILFSVGGVVAYLHEDEMKPFKLFELGIAAPALITSLITAQGMVVSPSQSTADQTTFNGPSIISSAYAGSEFHDLQKIVLAGNLFGDIVNGAIGKVYRDIGKPGEKVANPVDKVQNSLEIPSFFH